MSFLTRLRWLLLACNLLSACSRAPIPPPTPTSTPLPTPEPAVDAYLMNKRLARTVNIGNALEAPNEGEWGVTIQEEYFQIIHEAGFTAVRLPVRWSAHALEEAPYTMDPAFFQRVDQVIHEALTAGLVVIVNMHHYEEMALDADSHEARFITLWGQIAEHYKSYPNALLFEPMNEPNGAVVASRWNRLLAATLPVIRATNPTRNLVIGPADWNDLRGLDELALPADDQHIIVMFHYYQPYQFTHQAAEWVQGSASWLGTEWKGSSAEKQLVQYDFKTVAKWAEENHRPIFLGEFGAYSKADLASRARWTTFIAREAEKQGFSWGYWEFCAGFGVYSLENNQWNEPLLKALIPTP
jgi:endoglucanase